MTAPLNFLKVSFLSLTSLILIACHSDGPSRSLAPDINTLNIYTFDQTIYSFNEETGISTKRGEFDSGENQFVELNTDESKQGYEYAAYVFENSIYLLDYDKESNAKTIELTELFASQIVCGIFSHKIASQAAYADRGKSNRSVLHLPIITIEYKKAGQDCGSELNSRDTLDFTSAINDDETNTDITKSAGTSENTLGGLITDYSSNNSATSEVTAETDEEDLEKGSTGFLGKKTSLANSEIIETLVFNYKIDDIHDNWEKVLSPSAGVQVIKQVSNKQALVQEGSDIYVLNAPKLFTINSSDNNTPVQDRIDAMFSKSNLTLDDATVIESNESQNDETFIIKQNNKLYYYADEKFKQVPLNETQASQNATKIQFDLTSENIALVVQESNNIETLVAISTDTGLSTTILSAEKIEFYIIDNEFYVNTLELELGSGWQAHWFRKSNNNFAKETYNNSRLLFIPNLQEEQNTLYLLSSDDERSESSMIKPTLYKFDKYQSNGRKTSAGSVEFSFGRLNTDVSHITNSIIVNDNYGRISLKGINEDSNVGRSVEEYYFFNPSQLDADPDIDEQSLTLIRRIEL